MTASPMPAAAGLSLKPQHFDAALACAATGLWFEVHPENYLMAGGPRLAWLEAVRSRHPVALHGVSLSLAGADAPERQHLHALAALARRIEPVLISEHLAWSRADGRYFPDLLPVPRNQQTLQRLVRHIDQTQELLGRRIALENPSHYLHMPAHAWSEPAFLSELVRRTGCLLLVDVNNVYVSAANIGIDAADYLAQLPAAAIAEIHLAGHSGDQSLPGLLIDSHDAAIDEAVWALYRGLIERIGPRPTLIERDGNLPGFEALLRERSVAQEILDQCRQAQPA